MNRNIAIPFILICLYLIIIMIIGIIPYGVKRIDKYSTFHIASGLTGPVLVSLCVIVSFYSSSTWTGWHSIIIENGVLSAYVIPYISITGVIYYFISERIYPVAREHKLLTLGGYLENRFDNVNIKYVSSLISAVLGLLWITMEIITLGYVINFALEGLISLELSSFLGLLIILIYVLWGGMESVLWTDSIQAVLMIFGSIFVCLLVIRSYHGNLTELSESFISFNNNITINEYSKDINSLNNSRTWISYVITGSAGAICWPQIFSRIFMGKNINVQRITGIVISFSSIWCLSYIIIGLSSFDIGYLDGFETSFFETVKQIGNIYFFSFTCIFVLAASMGTIDSTILSISTIITTNLLSRSYLYKTYKQDEEKIILLSRYIMIVIALLAFTLNILYKSTIINLALLSYEGIAQLFPALIIGSYSIKKDAMAVIYGIIVGISVSIILNVANVFLIGFTPGFWGIICNLFTVIIFTYYHNTYKI